MLSLLIALFLLSVSAGHDEAFFHQLFLNGKRSSKEEHKCTTGGKPTPEFIDKYYQPECAKYGVTKEKAMEGSCAAPAVTQPSPCDAQAREYYHCAINRSPDGTTAGDGGVCAEMRTMARARARTVMNDCTALHPSWKHEKVADLYKRDCECYGDLHGPCGSIIVNAENQAGEGGTLQRMNSTLQSMNKAHKEFEECMRFAGILTTDERACKSSKRSNVVMDLAMMRPWGDNCCGKSVSNPSADLLNYRNVTCIQLVMQICEEVEYKAATELTTHFHDVSSFAVNVFPCD